MKKILRLVLALVALAVSVGSAVAGDVTNMVDFATMKTDIVTGMGIPATIAGVVFGLLFLLGLAFKTIKKGKAG